MKTNLFTGILLLAGGLGLARPVAAQRSDWQWQVRLAAPSNTPSLPGVSGSAVLATADGGVVASGGYKEYLALGTGRGDTLRSGAANNYAGFLAKYSATGQRQWAVSIDNGGLGQLVRDTQGNYICLIDHDVAVTTPVGTIPGRGMGWLRYSPSGNLLGGGEIVRNGYSVTALDVDAANDLLISGYLNTNLTIGGQSVSGSSSEGFVARLAPSGAARWLRTITRNSFSGGCRILGQAVLPNGDVLVGGSFYGSTITLDATHQLTTSGALGFLACYTGSTGAVRWARTVSVPVQPLVNATSGQAYVAGEFSGTLNFDGIAPTATDTDVFIARLDAATGTGQALVFAGGGPGDQQALVVSMQADGSFLLSGGATGGATSGASFGNFSIPAASPTSWVIYLLRVLPQGSVPWLYELPSALPYAATAATIDPTGNPYAIVTTGTRAVRFGQLPAFTPSNAGEAVLLHGGLVLATRAAGASAAALSVYPNPGQPGGTVTVSSAWPEAEVRVCDALGRQLWQGRLRQGRGTVPTPLPPGLYLVSVRAGAQQATQRLLVQ